MSDKESTVAKNRMIRILSDLYAGRGIDVDQVMAEYNVSKRSIQRDFKDIRDFLEEDDITGARTLVYDSKKELYVADPPLMTYLSEKEVFIIIKMLLESRGLNSQELDQIINKLVKSCLATDEERVHFMNIINRERIAYVAPRHGKDLIDKVWEIQEYIEKHSVLEIKYDRLHGDPSVRVVCPVGIVFSELYFYMIAFMIQDQYERLAYNHNDEYYPVIFRVDRISSKKVIRETGFRIPYDKTFSEGEFRKRVQFMFNGPLRKLKFYCQEFSVEAVLDRLPTAKVISQDPKDKRYLIEAEVYGGNGCDMWIRSQGNFIEIVK